MIALRSTGSSVIRRSNCRSPPAEKALPDPVMTTARTSSSAANSVQIRAEFTVEVFVGSVQRLRAVEGDDSNATQRLDLKLVVRSSTADSVHFVPPRRCNVASRDSNDFILTSMSPNANEKVDPLLDADAFAAAFESWLATDPACLAISSTPTPDFAKRVDVDVCPDGGAHRRGMVAIRLARRGGRPRRIDPPSRCNVGGAQPTRRPGHGPVRTPRDPGADPGGLRSCGHSSPRRCPNSSPDGSSGRRASPSQKPVPTSPACEPPPCQTAMGT